MTLKDDGEGISKTILDWLTRVGGIVTALGGIAAALAAIFALFFPNLGDEAQRIAIGVAVILAIGSIAVYAYQRRRAAKFKIAGSLEPLSATAALRGLLPFEEGDQLPGRARDVQELYTLVASSSFRFGVLWGESGCGKTSLMRAGLVPKLRIDKFLPLYIGKPTNNPQEAIRAALLKEVQSLEKQTNKSLNQLLKSAAPKGKKFVILFDQFEEFFLTNRTPKSRASFIKWLGETIVDENVPVEFLIGIRADFFAQLQNFAPQIPEPTSIRTTYQLQNFDTEQAKQIFSTAAKADGIQFEGELIQAVIRELETEEFIRPAELQVVGTRLKRKNITRLNKYEALGGARGILSSYIGDEIKQSQNEHTARLVLRLMCADAVETKSQTDLSLDDILNGVSGTDQSGKANAFSHPEEIQAILSQFVAARVIIHTDDDKYNLVHDYLAPYVRTATEGTETNVERANRMLKRYVAEYKEDPRARIPFGRSRWIQKYASKDIKSGEKAMELIKKSARAFYSIAAIPLILIASLYIFLASSYYFGIDQEANVVIISGNPQWKFVPGFDQVVIQTDFNESDLDSRYVFDMRNEMVTGFWFQRTEGGYQLWGEQLAAHLEYADQAKLLRLLGQTEYLMKILWQSFANSENSDVRSFATSALRQLAQTKPESFTLEMVQSLAALLTDEDPDVRSSAASALGQLAQTKPESFTLEMVQSLAALLTDEDPNVRYRAASALGQLAQTTPEFFTPEMVQSLAALLTDEDILVRSSYALEQLAQTKPEFFTPEMVQSLVALLTDEDPDVRSNAVSVLGQLAQTKPKSFTLEMVQSLVALLTDEDPDLRSNAASALGQLAQTKPESFTSEMVQSLAALLTDEDPHVRSSAASALGQLAQTKPESFTLEMVQSMVALLTDEDPYGRSNTVSVLGQLAQAKPEVIQSLAALLTDEDPNVRYRAASALGQLAQTKPESFTPEMVQSLAALLTDEDILVRSSYALEQFAQTKPESFTPEMVQSLAALLTDEDPDVRSNAVSVLGQLAQTKPESFTSEMVQSLAALLTDEDPDVRSFAAYVLRYLAQTKPEFFTSEMVQSLAALLTDEDPHVRSSAVSALGQLAQTKPESFSSEMVQSLAALLTDEDPHVRSNAVSALGQLAQTKPESFSSEMVQSLAALLTDEDPHVRSSAVSALGQLAQTKPEVIQSLVALLTDEDIHVRSNAASALGKLAQTKPESFTPEMIQSLAALLTDEDLHVRFSAASALERLAPTKPESFTTKMIQSLVALLTDEGPGERSSAASALEQLAQTKPEVVQSLFILLKNGKDSSGRKGAARELFLVAFEYPNQTDFIQDELEKLVKSPKPHLRVAASEVLEMIAVGNLAEEARTHPDQIQRIKFRLSNSSESLEEGHISFAESVVLQEIYEIENEINEAQLDSP